MKTLTGKEDMTDERIEAIRQELLSIKDKVGPELSWRNLAMQIKDMKQGTLSAWGSGNYNGNNAEIAKKVAIWINNYKNPNEILSFLPNKIPFVFTETAQLIDNRLYWASLGSIVIIVGDPGLGKTLAIKEFCARNANAWYFCASPTRKSLKAVLDELIAILDIDPGCSDICGKSNAIRAYLKNRGGVIVIDESQPLSELAIEEIRAIHDETNVGIAFVGNAEVVTRIEGNKREAAFAQRSSRVSKFDKLEIPTIKDVEMILDAWKIREADSRQLLINIAMIRGGGTLRTISKVIEMATMISNQTGAPRNFASFKTAYKDLHQNQTGVL